MAIKVILAVLGLLIGPLFLGFIFIFGGFTDYVLPQGAGRAGQW